MLSCSLVKQRNLFDVVTRQMGHVPPSGHRQWAGVLILSRVRLSVTPWTAARQAPLSVGFSRQEYRSGLPLPPPGDLCNPGIKPMCPALQACSLALSHQETPTGRREGGTLSSESAARRAIYHSPLSTASAVHPLERWVSQDMLSGLFPSCEWSVP